VFVLLALYSEFDMAVLRPHQWAGDFGAYWRALAAAQSGASAYFPFIVGESFFYHPFALSLFSALAWLGQEGAALAWAAINVAAYAGLVGVLLRLAEPQARDPLRRRFVLVLLLSFAPAWFTIHMGQVNLVIGLGLALSLYWAERERPAWAGLALALAVALKITPLLFAAYFLLICRYRVVLWTAAFLLAMSALAALQFGLPVLADFAAVLPRVSGGFNDSAYNHSLPTVLARLLAWVGIGGAQDVLVLAHRLLGLGLAALVLVWSALGARQEAAGRWRYAALVVVMTIASPLVWFHHNTFLLVPLIFLLRAQSERLRWAGVGIMLLVQSEKLFEVLTTALTGGPFLSGVPVLIAQGALLVICLRMAWQAQKTGRPSAAPRI
ncbi:MAG: DUF2029 domain-containing protein, partial [Anaerolineae bacterium]|nr:DUF2029 domain-containing protein [Anaerolineae bacterium]